MSRMLTLPLTFSALVLISMSATAQQATKGAPKTHPVPEKILQDWYAATSQINTIQGNHSRWKYDLTFGIEKRSDGLFFYVAPDKGRIDLIPSEVPKGTVSRKKKPDGTPFVVKPGAKERWICNGETLSQIDDIDKKREVFPIPERGRGKNIMDGPLPFLFGMPPDTVKKRYELSLLKHSPTQVWLKAIPKWKQDQVNYSEAMVILKTPEYLPIAVKLKVPGNQEITYTFSNLKTNQPPRTPGSPLLFWKQRDPFNPDDLRGYDTIVHKIPEPNQKVAKAGPKVPSVLSFPAQKAMQYLQQAGYKVQVVNGTAAKTADQHGIVYAQQPVGGTDLAPGATVKVAAYTAPASPPVTTADASQSGGVMVPDVTKLHWEQAKAKLQAAGFQVRVKSGRAIEQAKWHYFVYEQSLKANTKAKPGAAVIITVFDDPKRKQQ